MYIVMVISGLQPCPLVFKMSPTAGVKVSQFIGSWNNKSTAQLRCDVSARVKSCSK